MAARVTLIGGTFQDLAANPIANGTLVLQPMQDANVGGQMCGGIPVRVNLDANGNVSTTAAQMVYPNPVYAARVYKADGQLVWGPNYVPIPNIDPFDLAYWPSTPAVTSLGITPATSYVGLGAHIQFESIPSPVTGGVTWSAVEGSINSAGLYTAPGSPEADTVTVTSVINPAVSATAAVTAACLGLVNQTYFANNSQATSGTITLSGQATDGNFILINAIAGGSGSSSTGLTFTTGNGQSVTYYNASSVLATTPTVYVWQYIVALTHNETVINWSSTNMLLQNVEIVEQAACGALSGASASGSHLQSTSALDIGGNTAGGNKRVVIYDGAWTVADGLTVDWVLGTLTNGVIVANYTLPDLSFFTPGVAGQVVVIALNAGGSISDGTLTSNSNTSMVAVQSYFDES